MWGVKCYLFHDSLLNEHDEKSFVNLIAMVNAININKSPVRRESWEIVKF